MTIGVGIFVRVDCVTMHIGTEVRFPYEGSHLIFLLYQMFQFLCESALDYDQLLEKIKIGGYGPRLVSKIIWNPVPWEQIFSANNSGNFERSFWIKHTDNASSEIFLIRSLYNYTLPDTHNAININGIKQLKYIFFFNRISFINFIKRHNFHKINFNISLLIR